MARVGFTARCFGITPDIAPADGLAPLAARPRGHVALLQHHDYTAVWRPHAAASSTCSRHQLLRPLLSPPRAYSASQPKPEPAPVAGSTKFAVLSVLALVVLGVINRVLYKLALVPMHHYLFFLAQLQVWGYLIIYFTLLYTRYLAGKVTPAMLAVPKAPFVLVGACEAVAQLMLLISAAKLPAPILPLLMQTGMVWSLLFARLILGTRFQLQQVLGSLLVMAGVILASLPTSATSMHVDPLYAALLVGSTAFPGLSAIVKESIFRRAEQQLGGQKLDVLVVNAFGSTAQAFFVLLLLPMTTALRGIPLAELPNYLQQGCRCFLGLQPTCGADCSGAPALPLAYVAANVCFNIAVVNLLRLSGAVPVSLAVAAVVPLTILAFTMPLPYLEPVTLSLAFWCGVAVLMAGLVLYNWQSWVSMARAKSA